MVKAVRMTNDSGKSGRLYGLGDEVVVSGDGPVRVVRLNHPEHGAAVANARDRRVSSLGLCVGGCLPDLHPSIRQEQPWVTPQAGAEVA